MPGGGMIGRSERERELEKHIEGSFGPSKREKFFKRMAIVVIIVVILLMSLFIASVLKQTEVEENYAVVYSAATELYAGQLDLSASGWDSLLTATTITIYWDIPDWNVHEIRELTYFNRTSENGQLDYFRMDPITGQVVRDVSRNLVDFTVRIVIVTPSAEVNDLKLLGTSNHFEGTATNHPDKAVVDLVSSGSGVKLMDKGQIEVRNEPKRTDVNYWFIQFTRTKLS